MSKTTIRGAWGNTSEPKKTKAPFEEYCNGPRQQSKYERIFAGLEHGDCFECDTENKMIVYRSAMRDYVRRHKLPGKAFTSKICKDGVFRVWYLENQE